jgi:hypothetical protein
MVSDVGQHQCLRVAMQIQFDKSNVTSGGLGTIGLLYNWCQNGNARS